MYYTAALSNKPCFVEFKVPRLRNPVTVWQCKDDRSDLLALYGYCLPHENESSEKFLAENKTFYADRYGGRGVGANGGSARCGQLGKLQVKGIGRTPLVGSHSSFFKTHGGMMLEEALREAIWSEICALVLPYKAVKTVGVLATNTFTYDGISEKKEHLRGLLVREISVRPAHFMRSVIFQGDTRRLGLVHDTTRTINAVQSFPAALSHALHMDIFSGADLSAGLIEMLRRIAHQIATARARRIPHGALNCSNICLDGKFVDFGTMSAISDYGQIITAAGNPPLWKEHTSLFRTVIDLCFYLRNYLPVQYLKDLLPAAELIKNFNGDLRRYTQLEFLKLCGVDELTLARIDDSLKNSMWNVMQKIIRSGNDEPFKMRDMPLKFGNYHLNSILSKICTSSRSGAAGKEMQELIDEPEYREQFVRIYFDFKQAAVMYGPGNPEENKILIRNRSIALNKNLDPIFRFNLRDRIKKLCEIYEDGGDLRREVQLEIDRCRHLMDLDD